MILGRWGRAARALVRVGRVDANARVLDVGCAFGFGTARLPGHAVGVDRSWEYLRQGRWAHPGLPFIQGDAAALPFVDASFDAVVALDVLEHVSDANRVIREVARVVRPGGTFGLSVPNRGLFWRWDSLNRYDELRRTIRSLPPLDETERGGAAHGHYSIGAITGLLGTDFTVRHVETSGIGLAEVLNLALLVWCRGVLRSDALYRVLRYLYYTAYLLEDVVSLGQASYHLFVVAERAATTVAPKKGQEVSYSP